MFFFYSITSYLTVIPDLVQRQTFILRLARALMYFGAPSHRIESQLVSVSRTLEVDAQFVHMPSIVICSFGDQDTKTSETHFVKAGGRLMLGKLHNVHDVYRSVVHGHMDAKEGCSHLSRLLRSPPLYSIPLRCLFAFLCCFAICPMAFGGSLSDAFISGLGGALLCFLQLVVAHKNAMYADVFEISIAILMSFAARALSAIPGHVFCYQAISSSAVVLILPGYLILCSSLELASKNMLAGSVRMVYAIIYSLFLGFGLTIGSDVAFLVLPSLRISQNAATASLANIISLHGQFTADNSTGLLSSFNGSFTFANASMFGGEENPESLLEGCIRNPSSSFLLQAFPSWTLLLLVPLYSFISSLWNLQPLRSRQLPVMVIISCAAYAANKAANKYIFNRSDVVSAIGAFVVGLLGNIYSRVCGGTAFQVMSIGVSFLIPAGIAATGGLSQNYRGQDDDSYSAGLDIGLRMVQVAIGITVGLFGSGLVVYSFGSRKKNALFAF
ncbi:DUF1212-domain-containing protein [Ramaria rubella]|nr:DUF1212-domain-containing protein [Ramaria rubella]